MLDSVTALDLDASKGSSKQGWTQAAMDDDLPPFLQRTYHQAPSAPDGNYLKAGVPVAPLPAERQSLPLPSDLTNFGDPIRSQTNFEPLIHDRPRRNYRPPGPKPPNWITLNARLRENPRAYSHVDAIRGHHSSFPDAAMQQLNPSAARQLRPSHAQSERVRRRAAEAEMLGFELEQKKLATAELESRLAMMRIQPLKVRGNMFVETSHVWPTLTMPPNNGFAKVIAGNASVDSLVPPMFATESDSDPHAALKAVPQLSRAANMVLRASTSAYLPAGRTEVRSIPWSTSASSAAMPANVPWSVIGTRPITLMNPLVTHSMGLGGKRVL